MSEEKLDAKDLKCPMPIVEVSRKVKTMNIGDVLAIEATDKVFRPDIEAWCKKTGNELLSFEEVDNYFLAKVKKVN